MNVFADIRIFGTPVKTIIFAVFSLLLCTTSVVAADISVLCSTALSEPMAVLVPRFEHATGHKVEITFKTTNTILEQIRSGHGADLIIVGSEAATALEKEGKLLSGSRVDIGSTSVGIAVRSGTPKPDISSVEAFKQTFLSAKVVVISKSGLSSAHFLRVIEKLGMTNEIKPKLKFAEGSGRTAEYLGKGEADVAVQLISELMGVGGAEVVGPFPSGVDSKIVLTAGISVGAKEPEAAKSLITFLSSPTTGPALKKTGVDPM